MRITSRVFLLGNGLDIDADDLKFLMASVATEKGASKSEAAKSADLKLTFDQFAETMATLNFGFLMLFDQLGADDSGGLSKDEVMNGGLDFLGLNGEEMEKLWAELDEDGDGTVNFLGGGREGTRPFLLFTAGAPNSQPDPAPDRASSTALLNIPKNDLPLLFACKNDPIVCRLLVRNSWCSSAA